MEHLEHIAKLPKTALVSIKEGIVIVNDRRITYPSYEGSMDGLLTYYAQMSAIHDWTPTTVAAIIGAIAYDYKLLDHSDIDMIIESAIQKPVLIRTRLALWFGIASLAAFLSINVCLIWGNMHIQWDNYLIWAMFILECVSAATSAYCFHVFSKQNRH